MSQRDATLMILTRRTGESIKIGPDVTINIMEMREPYVRLGIEAPREMLCHLQEIYGIVRERNRESVNPSIEDFSAVEQLWLEKNSASGK